MAAHQGNSAKAAPWPWLLFILVISVFFGCATTGPQLDDNPDVAVEAWRNALRSRPYAAPHVVFAGVTVTKFSWKYQTLGSWGNSCKLIDTALGKWLNVPSSRRLLLREPGREDLKSFVTRMLPRKIMKGDTLILYLGTHQLKNGRILLSGKDSITAAELAKWLSTIPQRILLISDVCYSAAMESRGSFPSNCTRLHASAANGPAQDVRFDPGTRASRRFFARTLELIEHDLGLKHKRYSQMGVLFVQALQQLMSSGEAKVTVRMLCEQTILENQRFDKKEPNFTVPIGSAVSKNEGIIAAVDDRKKYVEILTNLLKGKDKQSFEKGIWSIAGIYDPALSIDESRKKVDEIQESLASQIEKNASPANVIRALNDYLFGKLKLKSVDHPYPEDFLLHLLLSERRGRCAALTSLYLVLAERMGLPLQAICLPEHVLVRWVDGKGGINIETTALGKQLSNDAYRRMRPWEKTEGAEQFYLQPLSRRQALATYLSPLGNILRMRGEVKLAAQVLQLAVDVNSNDAEAWNNLGMVKMQAGKLRDAKAAYRRAIVVNPRLAEAWNNLGNATSDPAARVGFLQKAVDFKPTLGIAWANLSLTWQRLGNPQKALECAKRAEQHGHELSPKYIQLLNQLINSRPKQQKQ